MFDALAGLFSSGISQILAFLLVLTIVVFFHELGHFLVARWCGVTVHSFSIGFGRELVGFDDRHGTRWKLSAIPLGGYVRFLDDTNPASVPGSLDALTEAEKQGAFQTKPVWKRAAIVAAGPLANFILAAVLYAIMNASVGVRMTPARIDEVAKGSPAEAAGLKAGDLITQIDSWSIETFDDVVRFVSAASGRALTITYERDGTPQTVSVMPKTIEQKDAIGITVRLGDLGIRHISAARVGDILPGTPAEQAGFKLGDVIKAIDGKPIASFTEIVATVTPQAGKKLVFTVERDGVEALIEVTPATVKAKDAEGKETTIGRIGIAPAQPEPQAVSLVEAVRLGIRETYANLAQTITGIGDIIATRQSADQIGGPILMAEVTARVAEHGIEPLVRWIALISANIGLLNLMPIPVLDGGHLVFYAIEAIRRKPLSQRFQEIGFQIGMALVLMLVVFVNLNDILRVGKRLFGGG